MDVSPKKSLGQNFLVDDYVIQQIIKAVEKRQFSSLIEVGPGLGALTIPLRHLTKKLLLIELDRKFSKYWASIGCDVLEKDALKLDWHTLDLSEEVLLVSNLPYQISSSLLMERSKGPGNITQMVLMFQKEVAERITSETSRKSYGILSVVAQIFWDVSFVCDAGPNCFFPPPQISSRVLAFKRKALTGELSLFNQPEYIANLFSFIKLSFSQRRKLLIKNIKPLVGEKKLESNINQFFNDFEIGEKARAEELSPDQFLKLFKSLYSLK
jgi:16S rRNA (adenine1518-N6/adenine1519-N6)-dimethyltransferase